MWKNYKKNSGCIGYVLVLLLGGCLAPTWETVQGPLQEEDLKVEIHLPEEWHRFRDSSGDIILTKYGLALQTIRLSKTFLSDLNENATKKLVPSALPHEVGNWISERFLASTHFMNQRIEKIEVATIDKHPGYQLTLSYRSPEGLTYHVLQYGYLHKEILFRLTYEAVAREYFERDIESFQQVLASYRDLQPPEN